MNGQVIANAVRTVSSIPSAAVMKAMTPTAALGTPIFIKLRYAVLLVHVKSNFTLSSVNSLLVCRLHDLFTLHANRIAGIADNVDRSAYFMNVQRPISGECAVHRFTHFHCVITFSYGQ